MKAPLSFATAVVITFLLIGATCSTTQAAIIGFDGILDETPVAAGNPYAGVLTIDAQTGWTEAVPEWPYLVWHSVPVLIYNERIDTTKVGRGPSFPPPHERSEIVATFMRPVTDVSFDAWAWRQATYEYRGVNDAGETFNGSGGIEGLDNTAPAQHISLTLPAGYYLAQFELTSRTAGSCCALIWIDDISFDLPSQSVPDAGDTALLLGLSCIALAGVRQRMGR